MIGKTQQTLAEQLVMAERHVRECEDLIKSQRVYLRHLERDGRTATGLRRFLARLERAQAHFTIDRDRLKAESAAWSSTTLAAP